MWETGGDCQPVSIRVNETSASPVLQKVHLKHTINFSIADVTFYCPVVSGLAELAGSACSALQSQIDAYVRAQKHGDDGDIIRRI